MKNNFKFYLIVGLLVLSGIVSWTGFLRTYVPKDTADINLFPKVIKGWTSEDIKLTDVEYQILETHNVVARNYKSPKGESVMLLIVYSQNNRKVSHPPEVCYTGSGLTVVDKKLDSVPLAGGDLDQLDFEKLYLESKMYNQVSIYWFKVGSQFTAKYLHQQIMIAWNYLTGHQVSSALVRISAFYTAKDDQQKAEKNVKEFASLIVPELFKYLP